VTDAVETAAKMIEQIATGSIACLCRIVEADLRKTPLP
jgi:hypothetical protein